MSAISCKNAKDAGAGPQGINLLRIPGVRTLIRSRAFPYSVQAVLLMVFVGLAVYGRALSAPEGVQAKLYAKGNLVTLLIWGLWWPSMVWTSVLFGRVWCMVCPLEFVSNLSERIGSRLGLRQFNLAKVLRAGWLIVILYVLLQMMVAGAQLHRTPTHTASFLFGLLLTAGAVGFLFKDRAFCRGFCPVGLLLGTYGRGGMLAVRAASADTCAHCRDKHCVVQRNRRNLDARSCPSLLNPAKLDTNTDCLVCGQCIKVCQPDNMQLVLRTPFSRHDARTPLASWPTTLFVMAVSGFVTSEVVSGWSSLEAGFLWVPEHLSDWLGLHAAHGWVAGVWFVAVYPSAFWLLLGCAAMLFGGVNRLTEAWRRMALPMAVVVAAAHMAKGLEKLSTWGGFLPLAVSKPDGVTMSLSIQSNAASAPLPLIPHAVFASAGVALIVLGLLLGIREARLADGMSWRPLDLPLILAALIYAGCVAGWAF